jgi:hypothetical protein
MNKSRALLVCLILSVLILSPALNCVAGFPLAAGTFPAGTIVVPMDDKQADRVHVYGLIHEFLRSTPDVQLARIIEPPDVSLNTALTPSGAVYQGGPFLIEAKFLTSISNLLSLSPFTGVTITQLTASFTSNKIFFVRQPTKILVIRGVFGRTDLTLERMGINYTIVDPDDVLNSPSIINQYSLIVLDCPGWYGNPSSYAPDRGAKIQTVYNTISSHVHAGNEVIYTDIALLDMNSTFPGYIDLASGGSGSWASTVYNPPKGGFQPEFPSQYYNGGTNPNSIQLFTEGGGWVVSSIEAAHTSDVRILIDSSQFGVPYRYAILGFYFQFGNGIVEGLAFHPYEQLYPNYADQNGYYATYEIYGNKFVHGPQLDFMLTGTPNAETISQGQTATYTITVTSIGSFSSPVNLQVTGGSPPASSVSFSPSTVTLTEGASVTSTLIIQATLGTTVASYNLTITGSSTLPAITRSTSLILNVQPAPADFTIDPNPKAPIPLLVNPAQCGNISITVRSIGSFSSPVNQTLSNLPARVTSKFLPNPITPPPSGTAASSLQFCVAPDAAPGNYTMTVSGTAITPAGSLTHTVDVLLRVPLLRPTINPLVYLVLLLMLLLALGVGLLAVVMSRRGVGRPGRRPRVQYVLPLPTVRCRSCGRVMPLHAVYCPYCGRPQPVLTRPLTRMTVRVGRNRLTRRGAVAFSLSLVSGILVILNSAALLVPSFYGPPVNWSRIFWWLPSIGLANAFVMGFMIGMVLILGSVVMILGHGAFADVIIFPFAVFSLIIGGGFVAGMILGVVGGVIGALRR